MGTDEGREAVGRKHETGWGEGGGLCLEWRREGKKEESYIVFWLLFCILNHTGEWKELNFDGKSPWFEPHIYKKRVIFFFIRFGIYNFNEIIT